jgi:superoxide dismutase, Fe-Mn family
MFQTAVSIHGSGWLWLVAAPKNELRVLATYNAGTPFNTGARQIKDPATQWNLDKSGESASEQVRGLRPNRKHEYLVLPLLGLNCWEHAYVTDYGVNGKQEYLKNWWAAINWQRVDNATRRTATNASKNRSEYTGI